ncbi:hypothetical protein KC19_7G017700 [Ceratodon purpureus]|uniref:Uncharacterized protein n=1 Tax=Ceratodon purpureus TaxID=3225 RepID=A0A8T0H9S0_CERPU|nr:hypothetical protein KC19_7G017700 [Ceratodon purpureus]
MATISLSTPFVTQVGALSSLVNNSSGRNHSTSPCRVNVAVCSTGIPSRLQDSLKMAVILPFAACTLLVASPLPAGAGILSGASGMESVELPSIPEPDFLKKLQEGKKKMYENQDETFRTSSYLQELLKKSKDNAAMHKKEIADKYCERGAEWGVGDCSLVGMTQAQKEEFMKVLRQK